MKKADANLPRIKASLGDDEQTIRRNSTYQFDPRPLNGIDALFATEPVVFEYTRPGCSFSMPPGRYLVFAMDDKHAVSVNVSPQLHYLPPDQAIALAFHISAVLEKAGWKRTKRYSTLEQARAEFANPKIEADHTIETEQWACGDDVVDIQINRDWRKEDSLPRTAGDSFDYLTVSVKINNDKLQDKYPGHA